MGNHVALIRGINVGRAKRVAMADEAAVGRALGDAVTVRNLKTMDRLRALVEAEG